MAWIVKNGVTVVYDGVEYGPGEAVPCSNSQGESVPNALERDGAPAPAEDPVKRPHMVVRYAVDPIHSGRG